MRIDISNQLFNSKRNLASSGVAIGTIGPAGITSSFNNTRQQKAKISTVAFGIERLSEGKISVTAIQNQPITYVEYTSDTDGVIPFIVDGSKAGEFIVKTKGDGPADNPHLCHWVIACIYASLVKNPEMRKVYEDRLIDELMFAKSASSVTGSSVVQNLMIVCDAFYYGIGKKGVMDISTDTAEMELETKRLVQGGILVHIPGTADPVLIKKPAKKKKQEQKQDTLFTEPLATFYEKCKEGKFLIDYDWPGVPANYIVPLSYLDSFIPTESFRDLLLSVWYQVNSVLKKIKEKKEGLTVKDYREIIGSNPINIKVMGKPGTGKTSMIEAVLASLGYPKGVINCKGRMEEDDIEGLNKFVNGTVMGIPTKAGELHSVGGAILLEEFNLPDPDILQGALGQALAYPYILKGDGYIEYVRHPLTIYFATMNVGTNGSKQMNEALSSRFPEGCILEDVSEDEFVSILVGNGYQKTKCRTVYRTYQKILNYLREHHEELVLSVTLRHCLNALRQMAIGFTPEQAYERTFIAQLYSSDPEVAKDVRDILKM